MALEHEMDRAFRAGQPLAVAFVDVDGLKAINDSRGHAAGDQMLVGVTTMLSASLRSYDLVIRFGGDEFLCVLPGLDMADANRRLDSVHSALKAATGGSVSIGIATLEQQDTAGALIARADAALYRGRAARNI